MMLRKFAKVPMVLLLVEGSIQVGIDLMFFKYAQILVGDGSTGSNGNTILMVALIAGGFALAIANLHFVNLAVKYYDQTDTVPIYSAATLITEILSGLILGGEFGLYNATQLLGILGSSLLCIVGIQVLVMKKSQLSFDDEPERTESGASNHVEPVVEETNQTEEEKRMQKY